MFVLIVNYVYVYDYRRRFKVLECFICWICCIVKDLDCYEQCFLEFLVEEVQLVLEEKLKLNVGDFEGGVYFYNYFYWEYVYDYEKILVIFGKKY